MLHVRTAQRRSTISQNTRFRTEKLRQPNAVPPQTFAHSLFLLLPLLEVDVSRAAVAKAHGQLQSLDATNVTDRRHDDAKLSKLLHLNATTLTELRVFTGAAEHDGRVRCFLRDAPCRLKILEMGVWADVPTARSMLRNEPPFALLRIRHLNVVEDRFVPWNGPQEVAACCGELRRHTFAKELVLRDAPLDADMTDVVDAAIASKMTYLSLPFAPY